MILTDPNQPEIDSELIVTLAKQALNNLPFREQYYAGMSSTQYRDEFGTVKIALPRQSGHSTAALQLLYEYPDAICFVPRGSHKQFIRNLTREYITDPADLARVQKAIMVACEETIQNIRPSWTRSFIIIDNCSNMKLDMQNYIKESLQASIILELQ